jgi:hypothetical protein
MLRAYRKERPMTLLQPTRPRSWRAAFLVAAALALALALAGGSGASLPKTIVVDVTTVDAPDANPADGVCSAKIITKGAHRCTLRAAVQTANAGPRGSYVIVLPAGTLHLFVAGKNEDDGAKGDLDLSQANLTLLGSGPAKTTIDGSGIDRVLDIPGFSFVTVQSLRLTGGALSTAGGAARVAGVLRLRNVLIDSNNAGEVGGGIFVERTGAADLSQVTISHNVAANGAGVDVEGHMSMTNVTIAGNNAKSEGGGILVIVGGKTSLLHVTIAGNTADSQHTSSAIGNRGSLSMRNSIVSGTCQHAKGVYFPHPDRNVVIDQRCSGDQAVPDPGLLPLTATGNLVPTMALASTSPAIDFASSSICPKVDARGVKRPQGAGCDAGAYERVPGA